MIIRSDWHMHSEASYDSKLPLQEIADAAEKYGFVAYGITDHFNDNSKSFLADIHKSAEIVKEFRKTHPNVVLGVELLPQPQPDFDHLKIHGSFEGFVPVISDEPYGMTFPMTKEELKALGVRYVVAASHWRADTCQHDPKNPIVSEWINEWHRQQMWMATEERVTILGHPWFSGKNLWYEDFSVIPHSMHEELGAALKENGKLVECNSHFFIAPTTTEKFRHQYAEFLREMFEKGIPVTYGSDCHNKYDVDPVAQVEPYLRAAGFVDGDFYDLTEKDLW